MQATCKVCNCKPIDWLSSIWHASDSCRITAVNEIFCLIIEAFRSTVTKCFKIAIELEFEHSNSTVGLGSASQIYSRQNTCIRITGSHTLNLHAAGSSCQKYRGLQGLTRATIDQSVSKACATRCPLGTIGHTARFTRQNYNRISTDNW